MKNKTKNIILGVSLGINILLALLVGGALIKSCNDAPTQTATIRRLGTSGGGEDEEESSSESTPDYPYITGARWQFNVVANNFLGASQFRYLSFTSNGENFVSLTYRKEGSICNIVYFRSLSPNEDSITAMTSAGNWVSDAYRTIEITTDYYGNSTALHTFLTNNATYLGNQNDPEYSSSEQSSEVVSSSEETTEDLTSEQTSAATSEGQPVDSLPSGFTLRFGERNPFSAWAENPKNDDPAISYDSNAPFVLYTGTASSETMGEVTAKYYRYQVGTFYVAGNPDAVYDTIALVTMNLSPDNYFLYNGGEEATLVGQEAYNKGAFIVANAYYLNSVTDERVAVLSMGMTSAKYGNTEIMALTNPSWANVGFRDIVYIGDNPQIEINGYTARVSWWLENNALSSSAAVGSMLLGDATTGVFGLIGQAFSSVASIFGVALIPGLTIGTLLFIPLVVLIILAILRLLAK